MCRTSQASAAHHNLAWELNNDARFEPVFGTFEQLIAEIDSLHPPLVCLSSEDFEYLHQRSDSLYRLRDCMLRAGYNVKIIVFLRPQADYSESLYAELTKHDLAISFPDFLKQILNSKVVVHRDIWRFAFDYNHLVDSFTAVLGPDAVHVRPYLSHMSADYLIRDFLSIICPHFDARYLDCPTAASKLNAKLNFAEVMHNLMTNKLKTHHTEIQQVISTLHDNRMSGSFDPLTLGELVKIYFRFLRPNRRMQMAHGVPVSCVSRCRFNEAIKAALGLGNGWRERRRIIKSLG
jgi:hypothetical protein